MKKFSSVCLLIATLLHLNSCIVTGPKFSNVDCVLKLKTGMTKTEVDTQLGIGPYDIYKFDSIGRSSYVYKYRVMDRRTVPFLLKETNGVKARGKYMDLIAYYDTTNVAYSFESKHTDSKLRETRLNFNNVMTLITVTVPAIFIYLGITE